MAETVGFWVMAVVLVGASLGGFSRDSFRGRPLPRRAGGHGRFMLLESRSFRRKLLSTGRRVTIVVFAIMLTERLVGQSIRQSNRYVFNGAVLAAAVFVGVVGFVVQRAAPPAPPAPVGEQMQALGRALVGPFGAALQLLAVLIRALLGGSLFARASLGPLRRTYLAALVSPSAVRRS